MDFLNILLHKKCKDKQNNLDVLNKFGIFTIGHNNTSCFVNVQIILTIIVVVTNQLYILCIYFVNKRLNECRKNIVLCASFSGPRSFFTLNFIWFITPG